LSGIDTSLLAIGDQLSVHNHATSVLLVTRSIAHR